MENSGVTTHTTERHFPGLDELRFLAQWLRHPGRVGSVAPSGHALAATMAAAVTVDAGAGGGAGMVVELGPGTGSVTRALLQAGVAPRDLVAIESNGAFADMLRARFSDIRVLTGDARELGSLLRDAGVGPVGAIVSSLPLLSIGADARRAILAGIAAALPADGVLVQYTYGPAAPVPRALAAELGLAGARARWVLANVPPAAVWRYRRRDAASSLSRAA